MKGAILYNCPNFSRLKLSHRVKWGFVAIMSTMSVMGSEPDRQLPSQQDDLLRAAAHVYLQNRDSFTRFTCRFTTRFGKALQWEDVLADRLEQVVAANGLWVVDGDKTLFELLADSGKIAALSVVDSDTQSVSVPFASVQYLGDSSIQLIVRPAHGIANIHPPESPANTPTLTPFNMNWMGVNEQWSPGHHILRALEAREECVYEGTEKHGEIEVAVVTVGSKDGRQHKYYMDPKRAFFPIETVVTNDGKIVFRYVITDIRSTLDGLWYPAKSYWVCYPSSHRPMFLVDIWDVEELLFDEIPESLCIDVPKGVTICDASVTKPAQYTLEKSEVVCIEDLRSVLDKARRIGDQRSQDIPMPIQPTSHNSGNRALILGINAAFLTAIAIIVFVRRRKSLQSAATD